MKTTCAQCGREFEVGQAECTPRTLQCCIAGETLEVPIVDAIPTRGYVIWNIDAEVMPGHLPVCRRSSSQRWPGGRDIDIQTLCAIPLEGAQAVLEAAIRGYNTIQKMERYMASEKALHEKDTTRRVRKALPLLRQVKHCEYLAEWGDAS